MDPTEDDSPPDNPDQAGDPAASSDLSDSGSTETAATEELRSGKGSSPRRDATAPPGPASPSGNSANNVTNGNGPRPVSFPIVITKEHRLFIEFADAVRRERYVGLCFGAPGVGKTASARYYSQWDKLAHQLDGSHPIGADDPDTSAEQILAARAVMFTPKVHNTPHHLDKEISYLCDRLGWNVELMLTQGRGVDEQGMLNAAGHAELLIVDEADRLKTAALEQLRDYHDRTGIGLILIGMPGIEKRLSRYPQLYSRVGFVHHYKPMSADEQAFVLARSWPHLRLADTDDYTTNEAVAAIARITSGNFRLTVRLISQIQRVLEINHMSIVTKEVVEAARKNLVIGTM
ncbi:AAA family ATPase [Nonomuraea sp. 10N515B]|uniref:AAA family ATPase n=1 Tax=Nonomuraea sp. 10N515B TaxID=3457422 RepID=UPI003FCE7136